MNDGRLSGLRCIHCGRTYPLFEIRYTCELCGDLLEVSTGTAVSTAPRSGADWRALFEERLRATAGPHRSGVWRYHELVLPDLGLDDIVTLPEGNTNLYRVPRLEAASETASVHIKHEGENPTLSFKDRGMTAGVSLARRLGATLVACASTGDTSAAMAAYAARVPGMRAMVVLPRNQVTVEQLAQPIAAGALTVSLPTDFDGCIRILRDVASRNPVYLLNSINPVRIEGQKAIAYEIAQQCGWDVPDWVVVPVGNAGNIAAIGRGFGDLSSLGITGRVPRLLGAQAEAAQPLVLSEREAFAQRVRVTAGPTAATAIKIGDPVSYEKAIRAVRGSGGRFIGASEQEIHDAKALVDSDGVYICPNSATAVAGFLKARAEGIIGRDERVVIVATAHGCKFSNATIGYHGPGLPGIVPGRANRVVEIEAEPRALERLLEAGVENPTR